MTIEDSLRKVQAEIAKLELMDTKGPEDKVLLAHYLDKEKRLEEALMRVKSVQAPKTPLKGTSQFKSPPPPVSN